MVFLKILVYLPLYLIIGTCAMIERVCQFIKDQAKELDWRLSGKRAEQLRQLTEPTYL